MIIQALRVDRPASHNSIRDMALENGEAAKVVEARYIDSVGGVEDTVKCLVVPQHVVCCEVREERGNRSSVELSPLRGVIR